MMSQRATVGHKADGAITRTEIGRVGDTEQQTRNCPLKKKIMETKKT